MGDAMTVSEVIGFSGAAIAAGAYAPQITHLIGERCSAGISIRAFVLWLVASMLVTVHALTIVDPVFIVLGVVQVAATGVILFFGHEYRYMVCALHRQHPEAAVEPRLRLASRSGAAPEGRTHDATRPQDRDQARLREARPR